MLCIRLIAHLCVCVTSLPLALAHSRWSCPEPRSPDTGIKEAPCGDDTDNFDDIGLLLQITPGPLLVKFEESVHHTGAPFRISLSGDGTDDSACVLLDHIPHNDCCEPDFYDPSTYTPYAITVMIPNIICERCSLHLSNPMTDKIGDDGFPLGIGCTDPGTCFSVYHSCTKAFRIVGDANDGAVERSDYECPSLNKAETGWPTTWMGDNGEVVNASIPGLYRRESSIWSENNSTLVTTVPWQFREDTGSCGSESTRVNASTVMQTSSPSTELTNAHDATPSSPASPALQLGLWSVLCVLTVCVLL